jgi:Mn2+/Fe2+ NRAMP family transporter
MNEHIDKLKIVFFAGALIVGAAAAYYGQPLIHNNEDAISLIATIFSILAGLLIGIVTLLSDPMLLPGATWRGAFVGKEVLTRRLRRHRLLFVVYLVTLVLILLALLVGDRSPLFLIWLERLFVFFTTVGFIYSFTLPWALARIQEERLDAILLQRRREAGLNDNTTAQPEKDAASPQAGKDVGDPK